MTALRGGLEKRRNLRGFVVEFLLIIFFVDLNRDLPSSKLRRYWHPDFKNAMFTASRNLVRFYTLRQSYRPLKFAV